ncbi:Phosphatidylinositol 4-kinase pik1 [Vanrija pseudolonga]|uniref:1-phosphatidylinositol 4-kinase n=1 Tax=Vanrija pseudolonga TaxID=143232 RepID=A0AAF0Y3Q5_9TREE|nr:Phosphatidylinositol 4-kinase pik1 [Vanrija pseudolonga]
MSHALLLRLFLSPYFSISVAMHYLKTYPESIGISHYLCWRMKSMPADEVEFYWPQICHLLVTRPTESNALENFVLQRAEESPHAAMLTFWFMQSALRDLTPTRLTNPRPFLICQRVLHRCHEILFGDPPEPSRSPYRSLPHSPGTPPHSIGSSSAAAALLNGPPDPVVPPVRVNPHAGSALVGMGMLMAGPALPGLTELVGDWAVAQGRRPMDDASEARARVEVDKSGGSDGAVNGRRWDGAAPRGHKAQPSYSETSDDDGPSSAPAARSRVLPASMIPPHQLRSQKPRVPHPSSTTPNLATPAESSPAFLAAQSAAADQRGRDPFSQSNDVDPFGQRSSTPPLMGHRSKTAPVQMAFHSVPEFSSNGSPRRASGQGRPPSAEALLATYSLEAQRRLLRSHYCRSEIRFLLLLEDISNRLLVIPKPARISALRAELTSLNHNLPAEVCMPLWCNADHHHDKGEGAGTPSKRRGSKAKGSSSAHSRVVRISPGDSVVLNSAERAPYLLHVEILEDDLDFDPTRRENRELLKKIVVQEDNKRRKREEGIAVASPLGGTFGPQIGGFVDLEDAPVTDEPETVESNEPKRISTPIPPDARKDVLPEEVEEMDLVEQLYGNKLSVRDNLPDLSDALPLPSAPKNKQLDLEVWNSGADADSRRSSLGGGTSSANGTPNGGGGLTVESPGLRPITPATPIPDDQDLNPPRRSTYITLEDYSERMRTAAVMLAQLNASLVPAVPETPSTQSTGGALRWIPGTGWITGSKDKEAAVDGQPPAPGSGGSGGKLRLAAAQAAAIKERIMEEMMALEEERVSRMTHRPEGVQIDTGVSTEGKTAEDEGIVRREINKADPSAAIFKESWTAKKSRIRASSPWGHLANWDVISVIVKTGADLRQEQLATQLIERFVRIWKEEKCDAYARFFRILITGETSGLVETITDAVSVHSIKKSEYARRVAEGVPIGHVSLMDHYVNTYGKQDSGIFARARRNFIKSLAGYSVITYLLQIKDRHNGNILVDRDGRLIHIDFGFMLSNSPGGNMGFEAAPFKLPLEYVEIMGGLDSPGFAYFKKLFKEAFEAARKHSDSLITIVELMQKDSKLDCFLLFGENTVNHFRDRFALGLTTAAVDAYLDRLIVSSTGSNYTRLYDTFQYYSQGVL